MGTPLVDLLIAQGVEVTALCRTDASARDLRERGALAVRGDLDAPGAWQGHVAGADVVFHAASPGIAPPLRGRQMRRLERLAAQGALAVSDAAAPGATLVMASCGLGDGTGPLRIAHPALAAEAALAGPSTRVVRLPWVYGPGGFIRDLARGLQMRRVRIVGPGGNHLALVGARDAAAALVAAAAAPPGRYAAVEDDRPTQTELVHHLCAGRGALRPDHLPPGIAALSMGGVLVEAMLADQAVPGDPPPGFVHAQRWRDDLLGALVA